MIVHHQPTPDGPHPATVVVPFRGDEGGARDRAWAYVRDWWRQTHPDWGLVEGTPPEGPWCKAAAVADAVRGWAPRPDEILVLADADVLAPGAGTAVDVIRAGGFRWAIPHLRVHRLTERATNTLYAEGRLPDPTRVAPRRAPHQRGSATISETYTGVPGGGAVVLPAAHYSQVPLDPRFLGWGQEDQAFGHALDVMLGPPLRVSAPLWHLWHPPPVRAGRQEPILGQATQMGRGIGNPEGLDLYRRYRHATTIERMSALLAEIPPPGS